jgi:hypothetical protein
MRKIALAVITLMLFKVMQTDGQALAGRLSALAFGDLYYYAQCDSSYNSLSNTVTGGNQGETGLTLRRIFLTYDAKLSPQIETRFRLEANDKTTNGGLMTVFVKNIYLRYNIFRKQFVQFGIIPTPAFEVSEESWGHRYLEKTILDLRKMVSPSDFGVSLRGNIDTAGVLKYWLMIGENCSFKPEVDHYKRLYGQLEYHPLENLSISVYGDINEKESVPDPYDTLGSNLAATESTVAFFIGYVFNEKLSVGVESYLTLAKNRYNTGTALANRQGAGITVFSGYTVTEKLGLILRYDYFNPNTDYKATGDIRHMFVGGLTWQVHPNFVLSPNVVIESYESASRDIDYQPSVTLRITFYYRF